MKKIIKTYFTLLITLSLIVTSSVDFAINKKENEIEVSNITEEKIAYLTFDDGPSSNTEKILEILDTYNIKSTFFVVGPSYHLKDKMLTKIANSGHTLAIHSYEHNYSYIYDSLDNYLQDFYKCLNWIKSTTGITPSIYRFPGGSSNTIASKKLITKIIKELNSKGFTHVDWNVDTLDSYAKNDQTKIIKNALFSIKTNESNNRYYQTILIHDDVKKSASIQALPTLIEKLKNKGYTFKTLNNTAHIIQHVKE